MMSGPIPISTETGKLLVWGYDGIEDNTIEQAEKASRLPFVKGHVALMPDAHFGFGSTVGSVIPTHGAIIPSAIGVDIGCGMIATKLNMTADQLPDNLDGLHSLIAASVPSGVGTGHDDLRGSESPYVPDGDWPELTQKQNEKAYKQFGTLGSGNHFVEIDLDEDDNVWVVLHSGSRGIGNELARVHIDGAKGLMKKYFIDLEEPDLAYLVEGTPEFDAYIKAMLWSQRYAAGNREEMLDAVLEAVCEFTELTFSTADRINCHHNYTEKEQHNGRSVWLTRKGAIRARTGDRGIIPGSMGTSTYIVSGLGNKASYDSASHGAGRKMSRGAARRTLDTQTLSDQMSGISWNNDSKLIDEDPRSYKDIDTVMAAQSDLVKIEHKLRQVLNYKGN